MMDYLLQTDYILFFWINHVFTNHLFDVIFPLLRDKYFWLPLYAFIITFLVLNFKQKGFIIILVLIIAISISDQLSSHVLKPFVHRLRPCNDPAISSMVRTVIGCKPGFSFPSSHAANHFTIAFFLGLTFLNYNRLVLIIGIIWAFLISYAQIYIGVHYPTDIICGAILGFIIGSGAFIFNQNLMLKSGIEQNTFF